MKKKGKMPPVSTNRKAFHDYFIHDTYEAGIVLTGTEVKSIRQGRVNLRDGFVRLSGEKCGSGMPISARMNRGTDLIRIRSEPVNCYCISMKF